MKSYDVLELIRLVAVLVLIIFAAALATPKGRLPLALRGVLKILKRDGLKAADIQDVQPVSTARRFVAFLLVLVAIVLAVI